MYPPVDPIDERNALREQLLVMVGQLSPEEHRSLCAYMTGWCPEEMSQAVRHWRALRAEVHAGLTGQTPQIEPQ